MYLSPEEVEINKVTERGRFLRLLYPVSLPLDTAVSLSRFPGNSSRGFSFRRRCGELFLVQGTISDDQVPKMVVP